MVRFPPIFLLLSLLFSEIAAQQIELSEKELLFIQEHPVITMGGEKDWEPMLVSNRRGISGFDRDMLDEIELLTGLTFEIEAGNWSEVVNKAENREIDGLLYSAKVPERASKFNFSDPYVYFQVGFYGRLDERAITKTENLKSGVVAVQASDQFSNNFIDSLDYFQKKVYPDRNAVIQAILSEEVDYYFGALDLDYYLAKNAVTGIKLVHLVPNQGFESVYSIRKDYPELVSIMNKAIKAIPVTRSNSLMKKWGFGNRSSVLVDKGIISRFIGITLVIVVVILLWVASLVGQIRKRKRIQARLQGMKANLQAQVENSSGLIYSLDQNMRVIVKNRNFEEFVKAFSGRVISVGDDFSEFIPDQFKENWVGRYRKGLDGEKYSVQDTSDLIGTGMKTYVTSFNPIEIKGEIAGVACFTEDITEYTSLNQYMINLMENSYDYIFIKDTDYRFVVASQSLADVMGLKTWKDFIGKTDFEINAENAPEFHEDERRVIEEGLYSINKEHSFKDKNGATRWVQSTNEPIYDKNKRIIGLSGVSRDITEAKRNEQSTKMLLSAIDTTGDYVTFFDRELKLFYLNKAAKEIFGEEDYIGMSLDRVLSPEVFEEVKLTVQEGLQERNKTRDELEIIVPETGEKRIVDSVVVKVMDDNDEFICFANIARDITNRKKLQEEVAAAKLNDELMRASFKAEDQERTRIAHDLHDGVQQKLATAAISLQALENGSVNRTISLINESISEIRRMSYNLSPRALNDLGLCAVIKDEINRLNEVQSDINFLFHDNIGDMRFEDAVEKNLYRIFQEATSNILKHSKATEVHMQLIKSGDILSMGIEDNGVGFDSKEVKEGGMGLASLRNRVSLISGAIEIDSSKQNGTNILIEIDL